MPRLPNDGEAVLGTKGWPSCLPSAGCGPGAVLGRTGQSTGGPGRAGGHCGERPGPARGEVVGQLQGSCWGAATWMGGWEAGKDLRGRGVGELGGTQGQGSSVSGRAGGLGGAVMTGEGRLGETSSPNPAAGRVSPPSSRKETRRPVLSLFTGFLNLELLFPSGDPRWTSG